MSFEYFADIGDIGDIHKDLTRVLRTSSIPYLTCQVDQEIRSQSDG